MKNKRITLLSAMILLIINLIFTVQVFANEDGNIQVISERYEIDNEKMIIKGIYPGTKYDKFYNRIQIEGENITKDIIPTKKEKNEGEIATGAQLVIEQDEIEKLRYTLVVVGDVTSSTDRKGQVNDEELVGDGDITGVDISTITQALADNNINDMFDDISKEAADVYKDGEINLKDVVVLRRIIVGWEGYKLVDDDSKFEWDERSDASKTITTKRELTYVVIAKDEEGEDIDDIQWSVTGGKLNKKTGREIEWTLPDEEGTYKITATNGKETIEKEIEYINFDLNLALRGNIIELDPNEDFDGDRLTNGYEEEIGTNPLVDDTDMDGITDYEEINEYHTDPLNDDTDGDGIYDLNEILVELDPLKEDTKNDGILDGERIITYTETNEELGVTITLKGNGNIADVIITEVEIPYLENMKELIIGPVINISTNGEVISGTLKIKYDSDIISEEQLDITGYKGKIYGFNADTQEITELKGNGISYTNKYVNANITDEIENISTFFIGAYKKNISENQFTGSKYKTFLIDERSLGQNEIDESILAIKNISSNLDYCKSLNLEFIVDDEYAFSNSINRINYMYQQTRTDNYSIILNRLINKYLWYDDKNITSGQTTQTGKSEFETYTPDFPKNSKIYKSELFSTSYWYPGNVELNIITNNLSNLPNNTDKDLFILRLNKLFIDMNVDINLININSNGEFLIKDTNEYNIEFNVINVKNIDELYNIFGCENNFTHDNTIEIKEEDGRTYIWETIADSGFDPKKNGFRYSNYGTTNQLGGQCVGIAKVAQKWYMHTLPISQTMEHIKENSILKTYEYNMQQLNIYDNFINALKKDNYGGSVRAMLDFLSETDINNVYHLDGDKGNYTIKTTDKYRKIVEDSDGLLKIIEHEGKVLGIEFWYEDIVLDIDKIRKKAEEYSELQVLLAIDYYFETQFNENGKLMYYKEAFTNYDDNIDYIDEMSDLERLISKLNEKNPVVITYLTTGSSFAEQLTQPYVAKRNADHGVNAISLLRNIRKPWLYKIAIYNNNTPGEIEYLNLTLKKGILDRKTKIKTYLNINSEFTNMYLHY